MRLNSHNILLHVSIVGWDTKPFNEYYQKGYTNNVLQEGHNDLSRVFYHGYRTEFMNTQQVNSEQQLTTHRHQQTVVIIKELVGVNNHIILITVYHLYLPFYSH